MTPQTRRDVRFGMIALALSGLLFLVGIPLRGDVDIADPASFLHGTSSRYYVLGWTVILAGGVVQLYGFFGLYRYLTYQASGLMTFLAYVLSVAGIALFLPLAAFFATSGPVIANLYQQGNQAVIAIVEAGLARGLGLALLIISSAAGIVGLILFATAIWRHGRLPRWTAVVFALSVLPLAFPITLATESLGALMLLVSTGVMAWRVWQESEAVV